MATKSLAELQAQIEKLQAEAAKLRDEERTGVVERIREAISMYGLTAQDLFGSGSRRGTAQRGRTSQSRRGLPAAYADGTGNVWGGRGPRPKWLREALEQGRQLEEFAAGSQANAAIDNVSASEAALAPSRRSSGERRLAQSSTRRAGAKKATKALPIKYRDDAGNAWSGRGPQPKWLKDALSSGQSLEAFEVR